MDENNQVYFRVGNLSASMEIQNGEVVGISAEDPEGTPYDGGFVFERMPLGSGCIICRRIGGRWVCQDIDCSVLTPVG